MKNGLIILFLMIANIQCADIFIEHEVFLVGKISLIYPNNQEDKGYRMVLNDKGFNKNILRDYVAELKGNESVLIVKCVSKETGDDVFYSIKHNNGVEPITVVSIAKEDYKRLKIRVKWKYSFNSEM